MERIGVKCIGVKHSGIFLDRDGLINEPPPAGDRYLLHPEAFRLMPGIAESIRMFNQRGLPVAVVTNQKGVAIGKLKESVLLEIHDRMCELLAAEGAAVQNIQYCPHREADGCICRKPLPGMIHAAAKALDIDPAESWMIGDQPRDLEAGRAAGCRTLLVGGAVTPPGLADAQLKRTAELPAWIEENFFF